MSTEIPPPAEGFSDRSSSARRAIEWIIAVLLVVFGLATATAGGLVFGLSDRGRITELVHDEFIESDVFTQAELIDLLVASLWWGGIGVILVGAVLLVAGIALGWYRYRIDSLDEEGVPASFTSNALIGAIVSVATSFIPLSVLIGGGVAGYIHLDDRWAGAMVGAFTGVLLMIPWVVVGGSLIIGIVLADFFMTAFILVLSLLFISVFNIGLGAVGGYVGTYLRNRD